MFERHIAIPIEDLRYLEIFCNQCDGGIFIDLDDPRARIPTSCPCCNVTNTGFTNELAGEIDKARDFRKAMRKFSKKAPQFRIRQE